MENFAIARHKMTGLDIIKPCPRSHALYANPISKLSFSSCKHESISWSNSSTLQNYVCRSKRTSFAVNASSKSHGDPSPTRKSPSWSMKSWIVGTVVSLILPSFTQKLGPIWVLKNRIDNSVQMVEDIAEAVEKVAEEVDKIAEQIGEDLPEGNLKKLVNSVENIAEKTAKAADALDDIIDKVQEMEEQVESMVESIITREGKSSHKEAKGSKNH